ncbi:MAG: YdbL family protein [Sphingomonas sp.]|nr:YdbL family protein [Sphingomonas sp.]
MRRSALLTVAALALSTAVSAQSPLLGEAIQAGQVGERYDGYLGITGAAPPQVERQVRAINIERRNLYIQLAQRRNVTPDLVGMATGCQLLSSLSAGEAYMLDDRVWRRRGAHPVALPNYCR